MSVSLAVAAGGVHEPPERPGLAYFLSRVLDRGTASRTAEEIADELDSRGVALQTRVTRHLLTLAFDCLSDDVDAMLALAADIVRAPVFPDDQIELRRAEILTQLRQDADSPAVCAVEGRMELLYGADHRYGRPPKGTPAAVEAVDRAALLRFHAERFAPAAVVLAIVGDIAPERAAASAAACFGDWTAPSPSDPPLPPVRPLEARRTRLLPMPAKAQADIAYGFVTIARTDPRYHAFAVVNNILGQYGLGGRIGDRVRERHGLAYYAYSVFDPHVLPGPLMIRAGVDGAAVDRTLAIIDEEVARMAAEGPTDAELEDARRFLVGSIPRMLETNAGIAQFLQMIEQFGLGLDYDVRLPALIGAVTREAAHEAARLLSPDRAAVVVAGPYDGALGGRPPAA